MSWESSHIFSNLAQSVVPHVHYNIQGNEYNIGYYLADCIYPKYSTILQTIQEPIGRKKKYLLCNKKHVGKIYNAQLEFFSLGSLLWKDMFVSRKNVFHDIMTTCIILDNMIIEDEHDLDAPIEVEREIPSTKIEIIGNNNVRFQEFFPIFFTSKCISWSSVEKLH